MTRLLTILLMISIANPAQSAIVYRVEAEGRSLRKIQHAVCRNIENGLSSELCENGVLRPAEFEAELNRTALLATVEQARDALREERVDRKFYLDWLRRVRPLRSQVGYSRDLPISVVAEAQLLMVLQQENKARDLIFKAAALSPEREIEGLSLWDEVGSEQQEKLRLWFMQFQRLKRKRKMPPTPLKHKMPSERAIRESVYIIAFKAEKLHLYQVDPLKGLQLRGVLSGAGEVEAIFYSQSDTKPSVLDVRPVTQELAAEPEPRWYNDWAFWAVASVVVAGVAVALSTNATPVEPPAKSGIKHR